MSRGGTKTWFLSKNRNSLYTQAFSTVVWYAKSEYGFVFFLLCRLTPPTRGSKIAFLHYKSFLKSASNGLKFGINLVHRIIRPTVNKLAQSDCWFNSYDFFRPFWAIFEKTASKYQSSWDVECVCIIIIIQRIIQQ